MHRPSIKKSLTKAAQAHMKVLNDRTFNIQTFTEQESKKFQTKIHSKAA